MIIQSIPTSFKLELAQGIHDFTTGTGDVFKMALYTSAADLSSLTTAYAVTEEIAGVGYVAGGAALTNVTPVITGASIVVDFADVSWAAATFTARGGLIYNSTNANRAVLILDFGVNRTVTNQTFTVQFPAPDTQFAIIRIN